MHLSLGHGHNQGRSHGASKRIVLPLTAASYRPTGVALNLSGTNLGRDGGAVVPPLVAPNMKVFIVNIIILAIASTNSCEL